MSTDAEKTTVTTSIVVAAPIDRALPVCRPEVKRA